MIGLEPVVHAFIRWTIKKNDRLTVDAIAEIWPLVVGKTWARNTCVSALKGTQLRVLVPDSVWLAELRYQSGRIVERLARFLPEEVSPISSIRLEVGIVPSQGVSHVAQGSSTSPTLGPLSEEMEEALQSIDDQPLRELLGRVVRLKHGLNESFDQ